MKKKLMLVLLSLTVALFGTIAMAEEQETEAAQETVAEERDMDPEQGTGWLAVKINGEDVEFTLSGAAKGMTGTTYSFESEDFTMSLMFNKKLVVGEAMETNAITQIEIMSSAASSSGYYFTKKSSSADVESTVTLTEQSEDGLLQGEFTVKVPTADRYVGDTKPGILPELDLTEGTFCFCE